MHLNHLRNLRITGHLTYWAGQLVLTLLLLSGQVMGQKSASKAPTKQAPTKAVVKVAARPSDIHLPIACAKAMTTVAQDNTLPAWALVSSPSWPNQTAVFNELLTASAEVLGQYNSLEAAIKPLDLRKFSPTTSLHPAVLTGWAAAAKLQQAGVRNLQTGAYTYHNHGTRHDAMTLVAPLGALSPDFETIRSLSWTWAHQLGYGQGVQTAMLMSHLYYQLRLGKTDQQAIASAAQLMPPSHVKTIAEDLLKWHGEYPQSIHTSWYKYLAKWGAVTPSPITAELPDHNADAIRSMAIVLNALLYSNTVADSCQTRYAISVTGLNTAENKALSWLASQGGAVVPNAWLYGWALSAKGRNNYGGGAVSSGTPNQDLTIPIVPLLQQANMAKRNLEPDQGANPFLTEDIVPYWPRKQGQLIVLPQKSSATKTVSLQAISYPNVKQVVWHWGDGAVTRGGLNATHAYKHDGTYTVSCYALCEDGLTRSTRWPLVVYGGKVLQSAWAIHLPAEQVLDQEAGLKLKIQSTPVLADQQRYGYWLNGKWHELKTSRLDTLKPLSLAGLRDVTVAIGLLTGYDRPDTLVLCAQQYKVAQLVPKLPQPVPPALVKSGLPWAIDGTTCYLAAHTTGLVIWSPKVLTQLGLFAIPAEDGRTMYFQDDIRLSWYRPQQALIRGRTVTSVSTVGELAAYGIRWQDVDGGSLVTIPWSTLKWTPDGERKLRLQLSASVTESGQPTYLFSSGQMPWFDVLSLGLVGVR